jgi:hypothetical protein
MMVTEPRTQVPPADVRLLATCRLTPTGQSLEVLLIARAQGGPRIVLDATDRDRTRAEAGADPAMLHELAAALTVLVPQISDPDETGTTFLDLERTDEDEPEQLVELQLLHDSVIELALLVQDVHEDGPDEPPSEFVTGLQVTLTSGYTGDTAVLDLDAGEARRLFVGVTAIAARTLPETSTSTGTGTSVSTSNKEIS